ILMEKGLLTYLKEKATIQDYKENDDVMALAEIQFTLTDSQMIHTLECATAYEAWEKLKSRHLHASKSNRIFLKQQFHSLTMRSGQSLEDFIKEGDLQAKNLRALGEALSAGDQSLALICGVRPAELYNAVTVFLLEGTKLDDYGYVC